MSLVFDKVGFRYNDRSDFELSNVSIYVKPGEIVGLAGATGSGKSTVIRLSCGLDVPSCGTIAIDGASTTGKSARSQLLRKVGVAFQNPERQMVAATTYDDIAFGPKNIGCTPDEIDTRVRRAASAMNLDIDAIKENSPFLLSGGTQRRAAIAGIIAMEPSYLVLDEPASGLDPQNREALLNLLVRLSEDRGIGIVVASHELEDLARICSRIYVLSEGKVSVEGSAKDVLGNTEILKNAGINAPLASAVRHSLQQKKVLNAHNGYCSVEDLAFEISEAYKAHIGAMKA